MKQIFNVNLPVTGEQFLGREKEVRYLLENIFLPACSGITRYLSVTGINRIGKTSLVREAWRRFDQQEHPGVLVIETSVSNHSQFWEYWVYGVVRPLYRKLKAETALPAEDLAELNGLFDFFLSDEKYEALLSGNNAAIAEGKGNIEELFELMRDLFELHVILIMDEFDLAKQVFGERIEYFNWFRGLLQKGGGLSVLTVSRRSIDYIQLNSQGGSTLSGVFSKYGLFGFTNNELDQYFQLLEENSRSLSAQDRERIYFHCGRSPFYLANMGVALLATEGPVDFNTVACQFYASFDAIINLLKEETLLRAMLQMFVGPRYDLRNTDVNRLCAMGYCMSRRSLEVQTDGHEYEDYLKPKKTGEYLTVCQQFVEYLAEVNKREVEALWPKLTATEQKLRKVVEREYRKQVTPQSGTTWQDLIWDDLTRVDPATGRSITTSTKLCNFSSSFYALYSKADLKQKQEVGNSALNLISLQELGELIYMRWNECGRYFSKSGYNAANFRGILTKLKDARNPHAHSNAQLLTQADIEEVNEICDNLVRSIQEELDRQSCTA